MGKIDYWKLLAEIDNEIRAAHGRFMRADEKSGEYGEHADWLDVWYEEGGVLRGLQKARLILTGSELILETPDEAV